MGKLKFILLCGLGAILVLLLLCYMIRFQKVEDLVSITRSMLASRCGPFKRLLCNPYLLMGAKLHQWLKENKRSGFLRQICLCAHILPTIYDKTLVLAEPWITVLLGFFNERERASGSPNMHCCFAQRLVLAGSFSHTLFRLFSGAISLKHSDTFHEEISRRITNIMKGIMRLKTVSMGNISILSSHGSASCRTVLIVFRC